MVIFIEVVGSWPARMITSLFFPCIEEFSSVVFYNKDWHSWPPLRRLAMILCKILIKLAVCWLNYLMLTWRLNRLQKDLVLLQGKLLFMDLFLFLTFSKSNIYVCTLTWNLNPSTCAFVCAFSYHLLHDLNG